MKIDNINLLRCPDCKLSQNCNLILNQNTAEIADGYIFSGELICKNCKRNYFIKNGIPNLLLPSIRESLEKSKVFQIRQTLEKLKKINVNYKDYESNENDTSLIIEEINAAESMAGGYRKYVADFFASAPSSAIDYERYEDLMLKKIIDGYVKNDKKLVFIEVGSGPGRYLIQYGGKISQDIKSCNRYRDHPDLQRFYSYDKDYEKNLELIIGIDFSETMIRNAQDWLEENHLEDLIYSDRIIQIIADIQNLNLNFRNTPFENSNKVVTCLFQTIGNQLNHRLRVNLVKKMMGLVQPHGTVLISAFHHKAFKEFIPKYYQKITGSIGRLSSTPDDIDKFTLKTKKGVFSHWFSVDEIKKILIDAKVEEDKIKIITGDDLPLFKKDEDYLSIGDQKNIRKRAIFAIIEI